MGVKWGGDTASAPPSHPRTAPHRQAEGGRSELPTTQELIESYGVSYGSIRTALLILKAEGLIEGRQGKVSSSAIPTVSSGR